LVELLSLSSFESHDFHDFDIDPSDLLCHWIVGNIYSSAFQISVQLLTSISEWNVVPVQQYRIQHPSIFRALNVTDHCGHLEMIEASILL